MVEIIRILVKLIDNKEPWCYYPPMRARSEQAFNIYTFSGQYTQQFLGAERAQFGGFLYRENSTGRVFGEAFDMHGRADLLGRMHLDQPNKSSRLFLLKMYRPQDPGIDETAAVVPAPIAYRLTRRVFGTQSAAGEGVWTGHYRIQDTPRIKGYNELRTVIGREHILLDPEGIERAQADLEAATQRMRRRLTQREAQILTFHPEQGKAIARIRGFKTDPPRLYF